MNSPEETFLAENVQQELHASNAENERRYSLLTLGAFQSVYKELWLASKV